MMPAGNQVIDCLINYPVSSVNFNYFLKRAAMFELKFALEQIPRKGNKFKRKTIKREIRSRDK